MTGGYAVDLAELKKLADVYLQDLANVYNDLNNKVAGTACFDGLAFQAYPLSSDRGMALAIPTEVASLELAANVTVKDALNFGANAAGAARSASNNLPQAGEELGIGGNTPAEMLDNMLTLVMPKPKPRSTA